MMELAEGFHRFGASGAGTGCLSLYKRLSQAVAEDPEVRDLLLVTPTTQRQPVLLFAVIHYLLLGGVEHRLARWYPTIGGRVDADDDPYQDFRDFVLGNRDRVSELLATRSTQTNEIGRCAILRPAWTVVADEVGRPLGLVELGSSAGLNLLLDRWAYAYTPEGPRYGDLARDVLVEAESRGGSLPALGGMELASRVGLDLNPIPVWDDEATRWLLACVWPDDTARFSRLQAALEVAQTSPARVVAGDLLEVLPSVVEQVPADQHLAIQNSWVLNYLPPSDRLRVIGLLSEVGRIRDLSWVSVESPAAATGLEFPPRPDSTENDAATVAVLSTWRGGHRAVRRLADCHPHGRWIHWW